MADLRHITQFMPTSWHQERLAGEKTTNHYSGFGNFLRQKRSYQNKSLVKGSLGEMQVAAWVHSITDNQNVVYNSVLVPNDYSATGDTEIDILWVGQHGITVIEVKSHGGGVEVHGNDNWLGFYPKKPQIDSWKITNPTSQCIRQVTVLKKHLEKKGFKIAVQCLLALPAANEVRVLDKPRIRIVSSQEDLIHFKRQRIYTRISKGTLSSLLLVLDKLERG